MIIQVKVYPGSGREEISLFTPVKALGEKINQIPIYKVYLKKPAKDNKANIELIKLLSKYFKSQIRIIKGLKNRKKVIEILR